MIHHTVNKHEWHVGGSASGGICSHDPMQPDHDKTWLVEGCKARHHTAFIEMVLNVGFLKSVQHCVKFTLIIQQ